MTRRAGLLPAGTLLAVASLLASTPAVGVVSAVTPPAAERPAIGAGALSIRITSLTPSIPEPGDELIIKGIVTNTSGAPVRDVSARLRVSPTPLVNRDEVPEVLGGAGQRLGQEVTGAVDPVADELAPAQSMPFELGAEVDDLGLATAGAYVTGAEALGDSGSGTVRQDLDRTFLPWWPTDTPTDTPVEPLLLTTLWPLTAAPLQDAEGALLTEDAAVDMSPAGRLSRLLDAGAADPGSVSLVVDPQAVQSAADLADGYLVHRPDGTVEPGTRSREVAGWLDRLTLALAAPGAEASGSLYAWPDVDAARRGKVLSTALRQQPAIDDATEEILGQPLAGSVVLAPGGVAMPGTLAALAAADVEVIVLSDRAAPLAEPTFFTPSGNVVLPTASGDLPTLLLDSGLADTLALPMGSPAEQTAVRQALLAQTLVTAVELPETQRLVVTGPDPAWDPPAGAADMVVTALTKAPWVTPTSLAAALSREPSTLARVLVGPTPEQEAQELPAAHVARVRDQYRELGEYAGVVSDPSLVPAVTRTAPARQLGAWFRTHAEARTALTDLVDDQVGGLIDTVRVVSSGSITVSGASGTIPITVENAGPMAVTVGLELTASPPQLFSADPVEPFTIEPERRTSVEVTAQVAASGPIPVRIQLVTAEGDPFGAPGLLVVDSAAYANAARVLVQVALGALVLAVVVHGVRRARRRRRRRSRSAQPAEQEAGTAQVAPQPAATSRDAPGRPVTDDPPDPEQEGIWRASSRRPRRVGPCRVPGPRRCQRCRPAGGRPAAGGADLQGCPDGRRDDHQPRHRPVPRRRDDGRPGPGHRRRHLHRRQHDPEHRLRADGRWGHERGLRAAAGPPQP